MKRYLTSVSIIAALAASGGAAFAQSNESDSFCDAGYVSADTNSDGVIDKEELEKVTEAEFSSLDANNDGTVTMAEYSDCRGSWTQLASNTKTMTDADLSVLDTNKDGTIDQSEYMDKADQEYMARWGTTGTDKEVRDAEFAPATPEGEAGDDAQDASATDAQAEPYLILRRMVFIPDDSKRTIGDMSRDEVAHRSAQMFLLLDTDRNKLIDPEEQKGESAQQASMDDMLSEDFKRADTDQSGDLSREEYAAETQARWEKAQEREGAENASDVGAPVVYYRYPHPM